MTIRLFALIAILGTLTALRAEAPPQRITVPFELLRTGHMTVMVKINGKGPYKLIFDTGAPITLLNNKIARESGLLKGVQRPLFSPFGSIGQVKVKSLEVGEQRAENLPAIVMDHPTVEAISKAFGPIDGIVGFPFFARFKMTLDYQTKTMTFVPNGFQPPDVMQAMMTTLMAMGKDQAAKVLVPAAQWGFRATKAEGDEEAGVTIKEVLPGSAAAEAGLKAGDRLLTLDRRWTDTMADLYNAVSEIKPGQPIPLKVLRNGKEQELKVIPKSGL